MAMEPGSPEWILALERLAFRVACTAAAQTREKLANGEMGFRMSRKRRNASRRPPRPAWHRLLKLSTHACFYCERAVRIGARTVDHVMPLVEGGDDVATNAVMACYECNRAKATHGLMGMLDQRVRAERRQAIVERLVHQTGLTTDELAHIQH